VVAVNWVTVATLSFRNAAFTRQQLEQTLRCRLKAAFQNKAQTFASNRFLLNQIHGK